MLLGKIRVRVNGVWWECTYFSNVRFPSSPRALLIVLTSGLGVRAGVVGAAGAAAVAVGAGSAAGVFLATAGSSAGFLASDDVDSVAGAEIRALI